MNIPRTLKIQVWPNQIQGCPYGPLNLFVPSIVRRLIMKQNRLLSMFLVIPMLLSMWLGVSGCVVVHDHHDDHDHHWDHDH